MLEVSIEMGMLIDSRISVSVFLERSVNDAITKRHCLKKTYVKHQLTVDSYCKEFACSAGDPGSIPGLGRSPGEGNGYSLQYSCLEEFMDRGA